MRCILFLLFAIESRDGIHDRDIPLLLRPVERVFHRRFPSGLLDLPLGVAISGEGQDFFFGVAGVQVMFLLGPYPPIALGIMFGDALAVPLDLWDFLLPAGVRVLSPDE